ncbi:MAG: PIN domain-containing protein [Bifidobacteriaceae bacterium]|jgi:predicted nucleic acid-binding protein|nr:PIN domain-containing protein [Bifidobacteriaceae bacterium]
MLAIFIDSCVLAPVALTNFLLRLAEAGVVQPHWSEQVLLDGERATRRARPDLPPEKAADRFRQMREFFEDAMVEGYEDLIDELDSPDPGDLHVVAAARKAQAQSLVTFNVVDFPAPRLALHGIDVLTPGQLLCQLIAKEPGPVSVRGDTRLAGCPVAGVLPTVTERLGRGAQFRRDLLRRHADVQIPPPASPYCWRSAQPGSAWLGSGGGRSGVCDWRPRPCDLKEFGRRLKLGWLAPKTATRRKGKSHGCSSV